MKTLKRLFERNGQLHGEVTFEFAGYPEVGLYRHEEKGPWMYYTGTLSGMSLEQVDTTNGRYPGESMPVIFWPEETTTFRFTTSIEQPGRPVRSLLALYKRIGTD